MSRVRDGPARFLSGYEGYLQADGYGRCDCIAIESNGQPLLVACGQHLRRQFYSQCEGAPDIACRLWLGSASCGCWNVWRKRTNNQPDLEGAGETDRPRRAGETVTGEHKNEKQPVSLATKQENSPAWSRPSVRLRALEVIAF